MKRGAIVLATLAVLASVAGCGGTSESAGTFVTRILREEISGQYAAQWKELHPGQQKLISQDQYVLCKERLGTNVGADKEHFTVRSTREAPFHERGVPERTADIVTISVAGKAMTATFHFHAVLDGGHWRWVLAPPFLTAIAHGECLDGSPLTTTS